MARQALAFALYTCLLAAGCSSQPSATPAGDTKAGEDDAERQARKSPASVDVERLPGSVRPEPIVVDTAVLLKEPVSDPVRRRAVASAHGTFAMLGMNRFEQEKTLDLLHEDIGLDSVLDSAVQVEPIERGVRDLELAQPVEVEAPVGICESYRILVELLDLTFLPGPSIAQFNANVGGELLLGSGGGLSALPSFQGRAGSAKEKLLRQFGGNDETEAAVARSLMWLAKQQNTATGFWEFDGSAKGDRIAATGMCLLPFLGAGETHKSGKKYKETVARGLNYLKAQIKPSGQFGSAGMYSQAIATMALCEAAGMTRDEQLRKIARLAVDYIVTAQAEDGSWGYTSGTQGDTSIVGWQIQALKSARLADIPVPHKAFDKAAGFLESVTENGERYGYRTKGAAHTLTAVGLLCRMSTGWTPRNPALVKGADWLAERFPPRANDFDLYYLYYATQLFHQLGGNAWQEKWNPAVQKLLLDKQVSDKTKGVRPPDIGSWPKDEFHIGNQCGKLGTTALACLTLEVYYRHLPLFKRDSGGVQEGQK